MVHPRGYRRGRSGTCRFARGGCECERSAFLDNGTGVAAAVTQGRLRGVGLCGFEQYTERINPFPTNGILVLYKKIRNGGVFKLVSEKFSFPFGQTFDRAFTKKTTKSLKK